MNLIAIVELTYIFYKPRVKTSKIDHLIGVTLIMPDFALEFGEGFLTLFVKQNPC